MILTDALETQLAASRANVRFQELLTDKLTTNMLRYSVGWSVQWKTEQGKPLRGYYLEWNRG